MRRHRQLEQRVIGSDVPLLRAMARRCGVQKVGRRGTEPVRRLTPFPQFPARRVWDGGIRWYPCRSSVAFFGV